MSIYQVDGKQYGIPYDFGMVGFWYNKALFDEAGITAPPATWDEFLADIGKLKDAKITPIALGGKDKWPGDVLVGVPVAPQRRPGGARARRSRPATGTPTPSSTPAPQLKKLIDLEPYQEGFLRGHLHRTRRPPWATARRPWS